jgi:hypothetical protein
MATVRFSIQPSSRSRCTKAALHGLVVEGVAAPKNPMVGTFACCARAPSGQTVAPPSAASNSRRPMVTVMRPSRARCVKGTIPRHEGAVFTLKEGWTAALAAQPKDERLSPVSPLASSVQGMTE